MSETLLVRPIKRRHIVVHWFGNCSYRRLKVTIEVRKMCCPHCGHELEDGSYYGKEMFVTNKKEPDYTRDNWMPLFEDGQQVWIANPEGG